MPSVVESIVKQAVKTFSFPSKDSLKNFNENFSNLLLQVGAVSSEDIHFEDHLLTQQVREVKSLRPDLRSTSLKIDVKYVNRAPVTYIQIFENEQVTLGVFVIREGNKLPLHNHPLMHGIIKVIAGTLKVTSYSVQDSSTAEEEGHSFHIPGLGVTPIPCYEQIPLHDTQDLEFHQSKIPQSSRPPRLCSRDILSYVESHRMFTAIRHPPSVISATDGAKHLTPLHRNIHEIHCVNGPAAFLDVIGPPYKPITIQDCTYFEDLGPLEDENKTIRMLRRIECPSYFYTDEEKYKGPPIELT